MDKKEIASFAIKAVENQKGDDLYRAKMAFRGLSDEEMNKEYGNSGKTKKEILESYQRNEDKCNEVILWLKEFA